MTSAAARTFADAIARKDPTAIQRALHAPLAFAGAWFPDPACMQQFPVATMIQADRLPAFGICLATLSVRPSTRRDRLFGVALFDDTGGIELAARFAFTNDSAQLIWFGYSGRRDASDPLPSITPEALSALRVDGLTALPAEMMTTLETDRRARDAEDTGAWLKVCIDQEGAMTGVRSVSVASPVAEQVLTEYVRSWQFRPFMIGGRALPACSLILLEYPVNRRAVVSLPLPIPIGADGLRVSTTALKRIEGQITITPDDDDKRRIRVLGASAVAGSFWYCVDEEGHVMTVNAIESTELANYDARIKSVMMTWRYRPFTVGGRSLKVCSTVTFIYHQRR